MTRRMNTLVDAGLALFLLAAAAGTALVVRRAQPEPTSGDLRPICKPNDMWVPFGAGWPTWTVCSDSNGYHTCWRPQNHTGRHAEWDLSNGRVTAIWPCGLRPDNPTVADAEVPE